MKLSAPVQEMGDAQLAGVRSPDKIRILVVPRIPRPVDGLLGQANRQLDLIKDGTGGLTLNYGIFIHIDSARDRSLHFHEFVHVAQYERLGGLEGSRPQYLEECLRCGYPNAPLEREAVEATARFVPA